MQEAEGIDFTLPSYEEIRVGTWSRQNNYTSEQKEDIAQKLDTLTRDAKDEWEKHSHSIMLQFREAYPDANIDMEMAKNIFFENYIL